MKSIQKQNILSIRSVTTDQSGQLEKAVREFSPSISHYHCLVHRLRNLQKKLQNLKLKSFIDGLDNITFSRHVARAVRSRIYFEILRWKKSVSSQNHFLLKIKQAAINIVSCFTGNHDRCSRVSVFCRASTKQKVLKSLPQHQYLVLSPIDEQKLKAELGRFVDTTGLSKLKLLTNTNKVESIHHRCFTVAPKNTHWPKNFEGLCHSAIHSDTKKTGKSSWILAERLGIRYGLQHPFSLHMAHLDRRAGYYKERQRSKKSKHKRHHTRMRRSYRKVYEKSMNSN